MSSSKFDTPPSAAISMKQNTKVTPQHTLDRVRNNQRRHRERRRDYIATLEEKLAEAENNLKDARNQVAVLKKELKECRCGERSISWGMQSALSTNIQFEAKPAALDPGCGDILTSKYERTDTSGLQSQGKDFDFSDPAIGFDPISAPVDETRSALPIFDLTDSILPQAQVIMIPSSSPQIIPTRPPSSCCVQPRTNREVDFAPSTSLLQSISTVSPLLPQLANTPDIPLHLLSDPTSATVSRINSPTTNSTENLYLAPIVTENESGIPSPSNSMDKDFESTILCKQAYELISAQNYKELSQYEVESWLSSGFRWPRTINNTEDMSAEEGWGGAEKGCRVETTLLFGLLTFISEV